MKTAMTLLIDSIKGGNAEKIDRSVLLAVLETYLSIERKQLEDAYCAGAFEYAETNLQTIEDNSINYFKTTYNE